MRAIGSARPGDFPWPKQSNHRQGSLDVAGNPGSVSCVLGEEPLHPLVTCGPHVFWDRKHSKRLTIPRRQSGSGRWSPPQCFWIRDSSLARGHAELPCSGELGSGLVHCGRLTLKRWRSLRSSVLTETPLGKSEPFLSIAQLENSDAQHYDRLSFFATNTTRLYLGLDGSPPRYSAIGHTTTLGPLHRGRGLIRSSSLPFTKG